jgi:hypothetical protein
MTINTHRCNLPCVTSRLSSGVLFDSPSAASIYIKRLVNPTRKADDGWKSIKYGGR